MHYRTPVVAGAHGVLFTLALFSSFLLAYNFRFNIKREQELFEWFFDLFLPLLAFALPIKLFVFHQLGQYRGSWRYVGLRDLFGVISSSLVASFALLFVYFVAENGWDQQYGHRLIDDAPRARLRESSVFLLDWSATIVFVCAARVLVRFYYEDLQPRRAEGSTRVLIVGAGDAGEAVVRQLPRLRQGHYICVGFVDDQVPELHGRIHNVEIMGRTSQIREICESHNVQEVFIAVPTATPKFIRELVERCEGTGARFRTVPGVADVIEGRVQVSQIRDVDITDLLGREPVELDQEKISREIRGQCVLVTGAGGSIGSEMCRQIATFSPRRLVLIERAENNLFELDRELRRSFPDLSILATVADIGDRERIEAVFQEERPAIVFHAAAHKHVPLMEHNPGEAIKNNVLGTMTVAEAAIGAGTEKMVMISTDKAVNPTSVMGCTKRIAELYVQGRNGRGRTQFITVRFGNVLGSSGSVVPIFKQQIAAGGPITVTHPEMKRYFMTIAEASQLVLQAGAMGKGGEIYLLHMGEPVKIVDLARDMISLSGLRPGIDIDIVFSGVRPGEKLFEELSGLGEHVGDTAHPKIGVWKHRPTDWEALRAGILRLLNVANTAEPDELQAEMQLLVPEYTPDHGSMDTVDGAPRNVVSKTPAVV